MFELVIYNEGCNSFVIRDGNYEEIGKGNSIAWIYDPLGFVHPEGPFFYP